MDDKEILKYKTASSIYLSLVLALGVGMLMLIVIHMMIVDRHKEELIRVQNEQEYRDVEKFAKVQQEAGRARTTLMFIYNYGMDTTIEYNNILNKLVISDLAKNADDHNYYVRRLNELGEASQLKDKKNGK